MLPEFLSRFRKNINRFSEIASSRQESMNDNPMFGYLLLFEKQHRTILLLYRGLMVTFAGFFLLVSVFAYRSFESLQIPDWGLFFLILLDIGLLAGFWKGFIELRRYRAKSRVILEKISTQLNKDLQQIKFLKIKNKSAINSPRKPVKNYEGWDMKTCSFCGVQVELLTEQCPACHRSQKEVLPS